MNCADRPCTGSCRQGRDCPQSTERTRAILSSWPAIATLVFIALCTAACMGGLINF